MPTSTIDEAIAEVAADTSNKKPLKVFRHRSISASVFQNDGKNGGKFYNVVLQRAYQAGDEWKHNSSFLRDEWPVARHLADFAWQHVIELESRANTES